MKKLTVNSNLNITGGELDNLDAEIMQPRVFKLLRKCGWRAVPWKRYVVLSFDIISLKVLSPSLTSEELQELPPYILFFSIQVVNTKTFQPIGKVLLKESTSPALIATCIKSFIRDLMRCEYFVVATVSRPIYFFQCVVQHLVQTDSLKQKTAAHLYKVEHLKIVHLYDAINMLENTFVLFLKYAITFKKNKEDFLATYSDCKTVMIHSKARNIVNYIFNNTNNVTCAVRLFSMTFYHEIQKCISKGKLKNTGSAELCFFFDTLLDSIHGNMDENTTKINRGPISKRSTHYKIWKKALSCLKSMGIVDKSGRNIPLKDVKNDPCNFKINDDYEYYEILSMISQVETESVLQIEKSMNEVLVKIKDIKLDDEKHSIQQQSLKTLEIELTDGEDTQNSNDVDKNENAELNDVNGLHLPIQNKDLSTEHEEYKSDCVTLSSEEVSTDILESYLKKLYITLRSSECSDVKISDNVNDVVNNNNKTNLQQNSKNRKECIDKYDKVEQHTKIFSIQHFDKNLSYLKYFENSGCMPKGFMYYKIDIIRGYAMDAHQKTNGIIEKCVINESDYLDENEITYTKEAIVSDDSYQEHENIEYKISDDHNGTNGTFIKNEKSIIDENCKSQNIIDNFQEVKKPYKRSKLNTTVVENILVALEYIRTRLESDGNNQPVLKEIINYLRTCDVVDSNIILQDNLEDYTSHITKSLEVMMIVLCNNYPNDSEKDIACINMNIISQRLRELKRENENRHENSEKASVSDIPDFFNSKNFNKNRKETKPNLSEVCKNIANVVAKILPKSTTATNEETENIDGAVQRCEEYADLTKIHADVKKAYPDINTIHMKFGDENKMESSDGSSSESDTDEAASEDINHPFVFDAWQITVNGMKEVFKFLQTKRLDELYTDSFNIDYIRQLINDIRKEHCEDLGNTHNIKMTIISPPAATYIFQIVGTLILE